MDQVCKALAPSKHHGRRFAFLVVLACTLTACGTIAWRHKPPVAKNAYDVGNVYVSAYPVVAWSDISSALVPNRNWTITDATSQAVNVTSTQSLQVASSLAAALGIDITGGTPSPAAGSSGTSGASSTAAPTIPSLSSASQLPTLPALAALSGLTAADGAQLLVASTALFQQAAILDNQITDQLMPYGYIAHLLTFQINLQPSRRDWSYNALVNITLIPAPFESAVVASRKTAPYDDGQAPVIIKPLIITDALETSSTARSIQEIRQALAQLSATVGHNGLAGLLGWGQNAQQSSAGYSNNSLVTAGVIDDSTLRVRLGAESDGNGNLVMAPRTYNVSVMVLTRTGDPVKGLIGVSQLEAITHTSFEPTEQSLGHGVVAPAPLDSYRNEQKLAKRIMNLIHGYDYPALQHNCGVEPSDQENPDSKFQESGHFDEATYLQFLRFVTHGDYAAVDECLHVGAAATIEDQERLYRMLAEMHELQYDTRYSRVIIPLGNDGTPRLPDTGQYGIVSDKEGQETITLMGGRNLRAEYLHPRVLLSQDAKGWVLPTNVTVTTANQSTLAISFAAPSTLKTTNPVATDGTPNKAPTGNQLSRLEIVLGPDYGQPCGVPSHGCYFNFLIQSAANESSTAAAASTTTVAGPPTAASAGCQGTLPLLSVSATTLRPIRDLSGLFEAGVNLSIGDLKKFAANCVTPSGTDQSSPLYKPPYSLVVTNSDLASHQDAPGSTCLTLNGNQLQPTAAGNCVSRLELDDLVDGSSVTLSLTDSNQKPLPSATVTLHVAYPDHSNRDLWPIH
jgi:hypothetical protein